MKDILRLLIIALLGYALYSYFVARDVETPDEMAASSPERCIARVDGAGKTFARALRSVSAPPVSKDDWRERYESVEREIGLAGAACSCSGDACTRARDALRKLQNLNAAVDDGIVADQGPPLDAARRYDEFRQTWEAAKALNR